MTAKSVKDLISFNLIMYTPVLKIITDVIINRIIC